MEWYAKYEIGGIDILITLVVNMNTHNDRHNNISERKTTRSNIR